MMHNFDGHPHPHFQQMMQDMQDLQGPEAQEGGFVMLQGIEINPNWAQEHLGQQQQQQLQDHEHQDVLQDHPDFLQLPPGVFPIDDIDPPSDDEEGEMAIL